MSDITHDANLRNAICLLVAAAVDAGTANPTPLLVLLDSVSAELASHEMGVPAFQSPMGGQMLANAIADCAAPVAGTPVRFEIRDRDRAVRFGGSVGAAGDLQLSGALQAGIASSVGSFIYVAAD